MKRISVSMFVLLAAVTLGCTPGICVTKSPGRFNKGIRYYRPKPYLLVTPINTGTVATATGSDGKPQSIVKADGVSDKYVQIQLQYLPDFSEEYAVRVQTGLGTAKVNMTLQDGWNLTSINQELDSKTSENINAVGNLIGNVAKLVPTSAGEGGSPQPPSGPIAATNVPLGYYESVIGTDHHGNKRLYGWRYVGFLPYNQCPVNAGGAEPWCCNQSGPVYGLVFEHGVMVFRQLDVVETGPDLTRDAAPAEPVPAGTGGATAKNQKELQDNLEQKKNEFETLGVEKVFVELKNGKLSVHITPTLDEKNAKQVAAEINSVITSLKLQGVEILMEDELPPPRLSK